MALGELLPVGAQDHRHVREDRRLLPERAIQRDLLGRVGDVIVAADDVGDLHRDVVRDDGEVVDRRTVGAEDDEVIEVATLPGDPAVNRIHPRDLLVGRREADRVRHPGRLPTRGFLGREMDRLPVEAERPTARLDRSALGVEFGGGEVVLVGQPLRQQRFGVGTVPGAILALKERPLVPGDAEPAHAVKNHLRVRVGAALLVGVLDPQHEGAAGPLGEEPVEERRPGPADVEVAGGGGGEADTRCGHGDP